MSNQPLSRRAMLGRAGLGIAAVGLATGCATAGAKSATPPGDPGASGSTGKVPRVADFPYEKHLPRGYRLDARAVKEAAYHAYYAGGCCHGTYSALLGHLATTAGAPFDQLPIDFGRFGIGGIEMYGSVCGSVLGGVLIMNSVVANAKARAAMITDVMRWYERAPFPAYVPAAQDAAEKGLTRDFSEAQISKLQVVPHSHLCHASVSGWCAANQVPANGADKKARCARLTADVAGKVVEVMNAYLATSSHVAAGLDAASTGCTTCHSAAAPELPAATGMECGACHTDKATGHPGGKPTRT
jgi:hypothetical protein